MACFALHILDVFLVGVNIAVAHRLITRMAIHTVEGVFALCKLCDWLIVVLQSTGRMVIPLDKTHCAQIVVAAVVAGIALRVWDCCAEFMLLSRMTCRTTRLAFIYFAFTWCPIDMAR